MARRRLQLGDYTFAVTDEGEGEPVLLLHGFPDSARLWRHQIPALLAAGFRVIAPDQRGFGESDKPQEAERYALREVIGDALGLLDALNLTRVRLVSHDWGAAVGWGLAAFHPERIERHVALSVGHLSALWHAGIAQRRLAWYMLMFMRRGLAEEILTRDDWAFFRDLWGHHGEMETWLADLRRPGALTAGLNWYRGNVDLETWTADGWVLPRVSVPTLGVWSSGDAYLTEVQMVGSAAYMDAPWEYRRVEGASHWLMLDCPQHIAELLVEYLTRPMTR
jgi:pimeloyl-ACP methyl ester carboxylesterase